MNLIEKILNRLFDHKVIVNCDHDPYLLRWYVIRTKRIGLFVHKFIRSDEDRALHDHPWAFIVIPVWRGYIEHSQRRCARCHGFSEQQWCDQCSTTGLENIKRRVWPFFSTRYRPATYRHRVALFRQILNRRGSWVIETKEKPSWSIFIRFTNYRTWGFWPTEGFIAWNKWWQDKCE